ncbi:cadherin-related family member 3-like [Megalops cyprinoides]|uniref:cadherin-related family member 3-like n=1 Tax=Megalops cyprinoides TaxID=118141 RepID=UPI001864C504|nr:cadherin-related family member 3-like [Megalops cyprinoides]
MDKKLKAFLSVIWPIGLIQGATADISFTGLPGTATVPENSPAGTKVYEFQVSFSAGASMEPGYPQIVNSNPLTSAFIASMVSTNQAQVTITGNPTLDFETAPNSFVLQILAVDTAGEAALQPLTVILSDVNEAPVFLDEDSVIYIMEKSSPGVIYQPSVSDPESKSLSFTLTPSNSAFSVDLHTGSLSTTKQFNYVTDPRSKITAFTIPEELNPGYIITNITAVVPDDSFYIGYILYTISTNNYLAIHRHTGIVTIANRMDRDSSPLRDDPVITVTVTAMYSPPGPPLSHSIELTITVLDINDNPPICNPDTQRREVPETEKLGALIATVTCTDNDVEPIFRKFKFTDLSCLACNLRFALSPVESNHIVLNGSLDFEDPNNLFVGNEYSLSVAAVDVNDTSLRGSAYVYVTVTPVNEYPPVFSPSSYVFNVSELEGIGTAIGSVNATDRDFPAVPVSYSIVSGGGTSGLSNIFYLEPVKGTIFLLTRPNYEVTQTYKLVVQAVDGDPIKPLSATATVTVNIIEANDEPPVCGPNNTNLIVPTNLHTGINIQSFILTCRDEDSPPTSFIYKISGTSSSSSFISSTGHRRGNVGASNINNHFVFSPLSGTNVTRLFLKEPFDYSGGLDKVWKYRLVVLITDANLMAGEPQPRGQVQTGTVVINIQVVDPETTTTPAITYITIKENTFAVDDWYVPFICTLGALLLLGILGYLLYRCGKYLANKDWSCCQPAEDKEALIPEPKEPPQKEVMLELTKINTVFDGEEVDPVTGRIYEYNSKSGARKWKDAAIVSKPQLTQPESSTLVIPKEAASPKSRPGTTQSQTKNGTGRADTAQLETNTERMQSSGDSPQTNQRPQSKRQSVQSNARPRSEAVPMVKVETTDLSEV